MAPSLEGDLRADVLVVGAGLSGCAAAFELARRGLRTIVLEAAVVGGGATAGELGHVRVGPGLFYTQAVARWGRERARQVWEAQRDNHAWLRELLSSFGDDCGYRAAGGFVLVDERAEGVALAESEDLLREDGFAGEFLDRYMLETRFDVTGFTAAYWAADEAEVDARRLVQALARAARGLGARIYEKTPVLALEAGGRGVEAVTARARVRAANAVLALGCATPRLLPALAPHLRAVSESGVVFEHDPAARVPTPARLAGSGAWRLTARGLSAVARTGEGCAPWRLEALVEERVAGAGGVLQRWAHARAWAADELPLVGPLPGLAAGVVCGHGGLGELQGLLAARWAAAALVSGRDPTPEPFRAARALAARQDPQ